MRLAAGAVLLGVVWLGHRASSDDAMPQRRDDERVHVTRGRSQPSTRTGLRAVPSIAALRSVTGRVVSAEGSALPGANVCSVGRSEACCALAKCALSDEFGHFELEDLDADVVAVAASAAAHLSRRQALPTAADAERSLTITLDPGGAEVEGRVVDATGGPLPFARVTLRSPNIGSELALTASDADGRFHLHVPPGEVHVVAQADAYSQAIRRVYAPARDVTLALAPSAAISGRVIRADDGEPVAGVDVTARSVASEPELLTTAQSERDGAFHIRGLAGAELYEVFAHGSAWRSGPELVSVEVAQTGGPVVLQVLPATTLTGLVQSDGEACSRADVNLLGPTSASARGAADGRVTINGLLPGVYRVNAYCPHALPYHGVIEIGRQPITPTWQLTRGLALQGRVESPNAEPVANAVVSIVPVGEPFERLSTHCSTAPNGTFSCSGLSPGSYDCSVDDAGDPTRGVVRVALAEGESPDIVLRTRPTGTLRVSLAPPRAREQRVLRVFARGPSGVPIEAAREQSTFVLTGMPLGEYEVYVELPTANGQPTRAHLTHDGQVTELELEAPPPMSIQGRAVDGLGTPWVDAWVSVVPSDPLARTSTATEPPTLTDDRGEFSVDGLAPGPYDVRISNGSGQGELRRIAAGSSGVEVLIESRGEPTEPTLGG